MKNRTLLVCALMCALSTPIVSSGNELARASAERAVRTLPIRLEDSAFKKQTNGSSGVEKPEWMDFNKRLTEVVTTNAAASIWNQVRWLRTETDLGGIKEVEETVVGCPFPNTPGWRHLWIGMRSRFWNTDAGGRKSFDSLVVQLIWPVPERGLFRKL